MSAARRLVTLLAASAAVYALAVRPRLLRWGFTNLKRRAERAHRAR
jgi:hypothetical protein